MRKIKSILYIISAFTMHWDDTNFPTDYPSNASFSPLIGWSHSSSNSFFDVGTTATEGIKEMAEIASIDTLQTELNAKISDGDGLDFILGSGLESGTGEISVEVEVDATNSAITLVSKLIPSPDWYVGALSVDLYDGNNFVDSTITAAVYDAGTDSGLSFVSDNSVTDPQGVISLFVDSPLGDGTELPTAFATVTFVKK